MGVSPNGWFIRKTPIKMDNLGYPYFRKPPYPDNIQIAIVVHPHLRKFPGSAQENLERST